MTHRGGPRGTEDVNHKLMLIDQYHLKQFAFFLKKLKQTPDVGGTNLLDNSMILYGSGMSDAGAQSLKNLPILIAGRGRGKIKQGFHRRFPRGTPLCNIYASMLQAMGVAVDSFADGRGRLS